MNGKFSSVVTKFIMVGFIILCFSGVLFAQTNGTMISLAEAKAIALEHAGVLESDVHFTKTKLDSFEYELKFVTSNRNQYKYEISYIDGRILDYDWDIKNPIVNVSIEEAKQIALTHANLTNEKVIFKKAKLDDGVYELDFITNVGNKYEYDISAINGKILDFEWDVRFSPSM